ncbi:hypothetical protein [Roseicyclus mahoneyensis]|uniref:Uncharacterized protein n=1 Tax=Roseicyclus mahoneyensis TaxID=164332 RepID=A0A316GH80_9RHOB|nr:hypothetical protein [Roseicyclus mahoneyensis]PWK59326.1 hypothetical protein C7455_10894 [Roseicyclus mahoneyensis]
MPEHHTVHNPLHDALDPDAALRLLDEVWAYYTPVREPVMPDDQYAAFPHLGTQLISASIMPIR